MMPTSAQTEPKPSASVTPPPRSVPAAAPARAMRQARARGGNGHPRAARDFRSDPADEIIAVTSLVHRVPLLTRDRLLLESPLLRRRGLLRPA